MTENISDLKTADRVEIFRHLAVNDFNCIDEKCLGCVSDKHLHAFLKFCDEVYAIKDTVAGISYEIKDDEIFFNIQSK
jgi:hypothetical protein